MDNHTPLPSIYDSMETIELFELAMSFREALTGDFINFFTMVSAYMVVAYLAGSTLTRLQTAMVTVLYSIVTLILIAGSIQLADEVQQVNTILDRGLSINLRLAVLLVLSSMWLMSLLFMFQIRRQFKSRANGGDT